MVFKIYAWIQVISIQEIILNVEISKNKKKQDSIQRI